LETNVSSRINSYAITIKLSQRIQLQIDKKTNIYDTSSHTTTWKSINKNHFIDR